MLPIFNNKNPSDISGGFFYFGTMINFPLRFVLFLLCTTILFHLGYSQKFLVLEKMGTRKRLEYHLQQSITYRLKGESFFRTDVIEDLVDDVIVFRFGFFRLKDIYAVDIRTKPIGKVDFSRHWLSFIVGGVGYFIVDQFNNAVINGNRARIDEKVLRTSAIITGAGVMMKVLKKKKVKLKRNWRLRIVEI